MGKLLAEWMGSVHALGVCQGVGGTTASCVWNSLSTKVHKAATLGEHNITTCCSGFTLAPAHLPSRHDPLTQPCSCVRRSLSRRWPMGVVKHVDGRDGVGGGSCPLTSRTLDVSQSIGFSKPLLTRRPPRYKTTSMSQMPARQGEDTMSFNISIRLRQTEHWGISLMRI